MFSFRKQSVPVCPPEDIYSKMTMERARAEAEPNATWDSVHLDGGMVTMALRELTVPITPEHGGMQGLRLLLLYLELGLDSLKGLLEEMGSSRYLPLSQSGTLEGQPQINLCHHCGSNASTKGEGSATLCAQNLVCCDPSFIQERCQWAICGDLQAKVHQTQHLVGL